MSEVLIDQLGGPEAVREIVDAMYERVFKDPELEEFFENVDHERLKRMQFEFISSALGGPLQYTGAELQAVHAGRGISPTHYSQFVGHLADVLTERGANKATLDRILGELAMFRDKIIGASNVDG